MIKTDNNFAIQEPNIPGWFSLVEMNMVYQSIVSAKSTKCIEIGSYMGRSGYAICSALNSLGGAGTVLCVDSFARQ